MLRLSLILAAAALAGCATRGPAGLDLDTSVNAVSQSSRVRAIVIHYTTEDDARSMQLLSKGKVSAHYLLSPRVAPTARSTKRAPPARRQQLLVWHHSHEQHVHRHRTGQRRLDPGRGRRPRLARL